MNNSNRSNNQSIEHQLLMQYVQINAFAEPSKIESKKLTKLQKNSSKKLSIFTKNNI